MASAISSFSFTPTAPGAIAASCRAVNPAPVSGWLCRKVLMLAPEVESSSFQFMVASYGCIPLLECETPDR